MARDLVAGIDSSTQSCTVLLRRLGDGAVVDRQFGTTDVFIYFPLSDMDARYKSRFGLAK